MLRDDEFKGDGRSYSTLFRVYDPLLGRWMSVDPLMKKFPSVSPYCAFNANPILFRDPYGSETSTALENDRIGPTIDKATNILKGYNQNIAQMKKDGKLNRIQELQSERDIFQNEFNNYLAEVEVLRASSILYDVGIPVDKDDNEKGGFISFACVEGREVVRLSAKNKAAGGNTGTDVHELKHMFQFEMGLISFTSDGMSGGLLYDVEDEIEAYNRGAIFNFDPWRASNPYTPMQENNSLFKKGGTYFVVPKSSEKGVNGNYSILKNVYSNYPPESLGGLTPIQFIIQFLRESGDIFNENRNYNEK